MLNSPSRHPTLATTTATYSCYRLASYVRDSIHDVVLLFLVSIARQSPITCAVRVWVRSHLHACKVFNVMSEPIETAF
jgi:hypothetical protein